MKVDMSNPEQPELIKAVDVEGAFAAQISIHSNDLSLAALESLEGSILLQTIWQTESREAYSAAHSSHSAHSSHVSHSAHSSHGSSWW